MGFSSHIIESSLKNFQHTNYAWPPLSEPVMSILNQISLLQVLLPFESFKMFSKFFCPHYWENLCCYKLLICVSTFHDHDIMLYFFPIELSLS